MNIKIKDFRENANLTQKELAKRLNIKQSTLSGYENGTRQPDFETLERIADLFNISIDMLLDHKKKDIYLITKETYKILIKARDAINEIEQINKPKTSKVIQGIGYLETNNGSIVFEQGKSKKD